MPRPRGLVPLVPGAKRKTWRLEEKGHGASVDLAFAAVRRQVLERDNFICRACTFRSAKWQEVHHLDDNHGNNDPDNLATICGPCHNVFHLGKAGLAREGVLIWAPEIKQPVLNLLVRALHAAERGPAEFREVAKSALADLGQRHEYVQTRLGSSNPLVLGEALLRLDDNAYARRIKTLRGVRLMATRRKWLDGADRFDEMMRHYLEEEGGAFHALPPTRWAQLLTPAGHA